MSSFQHPRLSPPLCDHRFKHGATPDSLTTGEALRALAKIMERQPCDHWVLPTEISERDPHGPSGARLSRGQVS